MISIEEAAGDAEEKNSKTHYPHSVDSLIVFGQGPIKLLLLPSELTPEQKSRWQAFEKDARREPNFFVLNDKSYLTKINSIKRDTTLSSTKKNEVISTLRKEWQHTGHFALKRNGRQNALAAGLALYSGLTKEVILSGGKTMPEWVRKQCPQIEWPSEASLMLDIIKRNFGKLYLEKYGKPIESVIKLEDESTNTLENFAYSMNKFAYILDHQIRIGLLSTAHHLKRLQFLAKLFCLTNVSSVVSAQDVIKQVREEQNAAKFIASIKDTLEYVDQTELARREEQCLRGLQDPKYITYWVGYVAEVKQPTVIDRLMQKITDPSWRDATKQTFEFLGLDIEDFSKVNLAYLYDNDPEKYYLLVNSLRKCKSPEYRKLPPQV